MSARDTGFHPRDADWTRGRQQALSDAESIARRQIGLARRITISTQEEPKP